MKAKTLTYFTDKLNKFDVTITDLKYDENEEKKKFVLTLNTKSEKNMTSLLEHLTKTETSKYRFTIEEITFDKEKERYICNLMVAIK
jgi:hypothetical protein